MKISAECFRKISRFLNLVQDEVEVVQIKSNEAIIRKRNGPNLVVEVNAER